MLRKGTYTKEMWNHIKVIMKEKNISIYRLAKLTNISDNTLRNYNYGAEPSFKNVVKITKVLDISLDELVKKIDKE